MPISSLTLSVEQGKIGAVRTMLKEKFGADVHPPVENCLVVVLEATTDDEMKKVFEQIANEDGIESANVAYYSHE